MPDNIKQKILLCITATGIISILFIDPVPQDNGYHLFADNRSFHGIANFWNVVSNLPFLVVGLSGMLFTYKNRSLIALQAGCFLFFTGIFFTGIGSAYYHLTPATNTLLWDRLPMALAFMSFFAICINRFVNNSIGTRLLLPLIATGLLSIVYWYITERTGSGDLRFYILVQFLPMLLIPVILLLYSGEKQSLNYYWLILLIYALAKVFEASDRFVYSTHFISGHTIKHFIAALAPFVFLRLLKKHVDPENVAPQY